MTRPPLMTKSWGGASALERRESMAAPETAAKMNSRRVVMVDLPCLIDGRAWDIEAPVMSLVHCSRDAAVPGRRRPSAEPAGPMGARCGDPQENTGGQSGKLYAFG